MLISDEHALSIVQTLSEHGFVSFYAGGCVRDALLGRDYDDIDIATDARPGEIIPLFNRTVQVGAHFGVVKVIMGGKEYDVAAFRSDGEYIDGRHPEKVTYSSPEEDAQRRDITINGMFYDPVNDKVVDFVGGREDLKKGIVRSIGDPEKRIGEDRLRMLRIIRFAGTLGFDIDPETYRVVQDMKGEITDVSVERITEEFSRMLGGDRPADCVELLLGSGFMTEIVPEVMEMKGVEQPPQFHPEGDVLEHTLLMLRLFQEEIPNRFRSSLIISLAVLFHDIGKPLTFTRTDRIRFSGHCVKGSRLARGIMKRLRFSNHIIEQVCDLILQHMKFMEVENMRESTLKRFLRQDHFDDHLILHWLDCMGSHRDMTAYNFCVEKRDIFRQEERTFRPPPLISGHDLINEGYTPGSLFKEMLEYAEDCQLEGKAGTKEEVLEYIRERFSG